MTRCRIIYPQPSQTNYTMSYDHSRRDFLSKACPAIVFTVLALPGCDSNAMEGEDDLLTPDEGVTIEGSTITLDLRGTRTSALATSGGFLYISPAKVVAVNTGGSTIRAFTSICTHEGCDVDQFQGGRMVCPCHGSQYDTSGNVVQGPATGALKEYPVTRTGNTVTIVKS